jgi:general stress protein 26
MNSTDFRVYLKNFLKSQQLAVLATQSLNAPYANLIAFCNTDTTREILFATLKNTSKYKNLKKNNKVSVLFDNRKNNVSDFSKAITATAIGTAFEIDKRKYRDVYLAKFPYLEDFLNNPNCSLIMVTVDKYIVVENFKDKTTYIPR